MRDKEAFGIVLMMCILWVVISIYKAIRWSVDKSVRREHYSTFYLYYFGGWSGIWNIISIAYIPFMFLCWLGMYLGRCL